MGLQDEPEGGLLWTLTALAYQWRTAARCMTCGRGRHGPARWARPQAVRRKVGAANRVGIAAWAWSSGQVD
ncbi:hypothetical protein [Nonomuraea sp. CA-141351]|uniref:hypothetical protein n=1 Tax=Nonomuraea sp. CA-141351 TaxID=3239996 RepID=UPI003D93C5BD